MMFIWLIVIISIVLYFDKDRNHSRYGPRKETPLELLDKRFVSGEISEEEYRNTKNLLRK